MISNKPRRSSIIILALILNKTCGWSSPNIAGRPSVSNDSFRLFGFDEHQNDNKVSSNEATPNELSSMYNPTMDRRNLLLGSGFYVGSLPSIVAASTETPTSASASASGNTPTPNLTQITDPQTYSALVYSPTPPPPSSSSSSSLTSPTTYPLLFVLHGAAKNERDVWNLADIQGEHSGLPPSLIASGRAPSELTNHFIVVAPYAGRNIQSFYEEPRRKLLQFLDWFVEDYNHQHSNVVIDPSKIYLLGFSDGATCGIELMTTRKFAAGIIAAYGFTGVLPTKALERLVGLPLWVFHSADDVIFPVECSDRLVQSLQSANRDRREDGDMIRYSRFENDPEGFTGRVRGHSTGITASKMPEVYQWLLGLSSTSSSS